MRLGVNLTDSTRRASQAAREREEFLEELRRMPEERIAKLQTPKAESGVSGGREGRGPVCETLMRFKLFILILFVIAALALLPARSRATSPAANQADCDRIKSDDATARVIKLDIRGTRGVVLFRHRHHETYLNPDSQFAHQGRQGAECIGCHHKRTEFSGVPVLVKCIACHGVDGDPRNPRNKDGDEERSQRAFHDLCIGCHRASNAKSLVRCDKAPVACSECHSSKS